MGTRHRQRFTRETIEQFVQEILQKGQPETINDLVASLQRQFEVPKSQAIEVIQAMLAERKFTIRKPELPAPRTLWDYLKHPRYRWDALLVLGPTIAIIPVVALSEDFPEITLLSLFRAILALAFLLFITGYSLTSLLFPTNEDLDEIERIALSVGLSLAVAIVIGLILNFMWEITLFPILGCLVLLTLGTYSLTMFIRIQEPDALKTFRQKVADRLWSQTGEIAYPQPTSLKEYIEIPYFRAELLLILGFSLSSMISLGFLIFAEDLVQLESLFTLIGMLSLLILSILAVQMLVLPWPMRGDLLNRATIGITGGLAILLVISVLSALVSQILGVQDIIIFILGLMLLFVHNTTLLTIYRRLTAKKVRSAKNFDT